MRRTRLDTHGNSRDFTLRVPEDVAGAEQDEEWFVLETAVSSRPVRIHDYAELYRIPGLYEALVYDVLQCSSHQRMADVLHCVLQERGDSRPSASVLELGAGNGVAGEKLKALGIGTITGLDLLEDARVAARRDRPGLYDEYVVADLTKTNPLAGRTFDGLVVVSALGFGDIPTEAFLRAANLVRPGGWIGMTIKSEFLEPNDTTGFGVLVRELLNSDLAELEAYQRYRHRISIAGEDIFYVVLVAKKLSHFIEQRPIRAPIAAQADGGTVGLPGAP